MPAITLQPLEMVLGLAAALTLGGFLGFFLRAWLDDRQQARSKRALEELLAEPRPAPGLFAPPRAQPGRGERGSTWAAEPAPAAAPETGPAAPTDALGPRAAVGQPGPVPRHAATILIVDDRLELRAVHTAFLESHGYRVLEAGDGDAALEVARRHRPDAILLDHSLPRRTGLQVARELKADTSTARIPIVFMTAHSYGAVGANAMAAGCVAFLPKPCDPSRVLKEIMRHAPLPPAARA